MVDDPTRKKTQKGFSSDLDQTLMSKNNTKDYPSESSDFKDLTMKFTPLSRYDFDMSIVDNWCEIRAKCAPKRRCYQSSFIYQNELYVFGGTDISEQKSDDFYKIHLQDPEIKWVKLNPTGQCPEPIAYHSGTLYKEKYYVIGGENNYKVNQRTLYIYDIKENKWEKKKIDDSPLPAIESHSAVIFEDEIWPKILIFGGYSKGRFCNDIYTYDIYKEEWKKIEQGEKIPEPRIAHAVCVYNGNMYLFGGKTQDAKHLNDLWVYNIKENIWNQIIPDGEIPKGRSGHSMVCYKDKMYIFGGKVGAIHEINELMMYNIKTNEMKLLHDTLLEQYSEKELNQINTLKNTVVEDKKSTKKIKVSPSKKDLKTTTLKDGKMVKTNFNNGSQNKQKYEEELMHSPNSKGMRNSLIYKMDTTESLSNKTKLSSILLKNKTLKISKLFGSVPMPRDGHSSLLYYDTMIVFGGDRNKFPLNDLFIFHLENYENKQF